MGPSGLPSLLFFALAVGTALGVENPTHLGETLLSLLRSEELINDTIVFECRDSTERKAHRLVLSATSKKLRENITDEDWVEVPFPGAVVDKILDFIYTNKKIEIESGTVIDIFAAAKRFYLDGLVEQLRTLARATIREWIKNRDFLTDQPVENVKQIWEVIVDASLSLFDKTILINEITGWGRRLNIDPSMVISFVQAILEEGKANQGYSIIQATPEAGDKTIRINEITGRGRRLEVDPSTVINYVRAILEEGTAN